MTSLDLDALRARLRARQPARHRIDGFRDAAVLVPILVEPEQPERLILTLRRPDLRSHAGQVCFPGGGRDRTDADSAATAIRETAEELGIEPAAVEVLGQLDDVPTPTGYVVAPVVGAVRGPVALRPALAEVAETIVVALSALGPASHHTNGVREFLGVRYEMHEYHVDRWRIWGATARIIWQLLPLLDGHTEAA
jgi:8-oxo-dGTP pyrophosphatase MutT (NUDIX family)